MKPQTFRTKPDVPRQIEAMQVHDDLALVFEVVKWIDSHGGGVTDPLRTIDCAFRLHTSAGPMTVNVGDWVIRDDDGFYLCAPDAFLDAYEPA